MAGLKALGSKLRPSTRFRVKLPPKVVDAELTTNEHRDWRDAVLKRAGYRCEWVERGVRCMKAAPHDRLTADHIKERKDGGALYDPANGQCLCVRHNTIKGARARMKRLNPSKGAGGVES